MDQQIINETSYRREHSARRRINQMENILRAGPVWQDLFNKPLFQWSGNYLLRQQCDADTACRRLKSHAQIICYQPRLQFDVLRPIIGICQVPSRPTVENVIGAGDGIELRQVGWVFGASIPVKKVRARDHHALRIPQSFRDESGHILYYGYCANRDVKSFLNHIDRPVRRLDEESNFWMFRHIAGECMSQTPLRQEDWTAEPDEPRRFPTQFCDAIICCLRSLDSRDTSFKEALPGFCESQSSSGSLQ